MTAPPTSPAASTLLRFADRVTALADSPIPAAIRAGVVAVVPLTIVGGLFMLIALAVVAAGAVAYYLTVLLPSMSEV